MRLSYVNIIFVRAGMSELADEADSKSVDGNIVWVQVPLPALRPPYLYILTLLFCNPDIIKTVKCCKVIFRCLCTADHLHTSVFFEQ